VQFALQLCDNAVGLVKGEITISGPREGIAEQELADVYMGGHRLEDSAKELI
jgi:ABC-type phosphate/phosphonate transport system ATPase subunit